MKYKLAECAEIISGGTPKRTKKEYWNGNIPWITVKDFEGKFIEYTDEKISKLGLENSSVNVTEDQDILISARGTVGKIAMVYQGCTFNQSIYGLRVHRDIIMPDYLYYWLICHVSMIRQNTHGSVFNTITKETFSHLVIEVPSLEEQKKIVKKINPFDEKIALNNQINDNLAKLKTEIFNNMFDSKLKYHLNGKLQDITKITTGKRPRVKSNIRKSNNKYPIIGASKIMGYTSEYLYNDSIITTGRVGTHGIVQRFREPVWVSDNSFVFITEHEDYLYEILSHRINYDAINTGSTQPLITQTNLKNIDIYVPTKKQFQNFENKTFFITTQQFIFKQQNNLLRRIKSQMLKKFF